MFGFRVVADTIDLLSNSDTASGGLEVKNISTGVVASC